MSWGRNHNWILNFWRDVTASRPGRTQILATLFDGDLLLRDALAHALVRDQLRARHADSVSYRYVRAWTTTHGPPLLPTEDVIFLGRPKPFHSSSLSELAVDLERTAHGRFMDPGNGITGNGIRYQQRLFSRHDLEEAPPEPWRRCDRDYAIVFYRQLKDRAGALHHVLSLGGLGTLGTLGAVLMFTDVRHRETLRSQVRELLPWAADLRPAEGFELCVRIEVAGEPQLANFLNAPDFNLLVEAVAISGRPLQLRKETSPQLNLVGHGGDRSGGALHLHGQAEIPLPRARFALLRRLVQDPARTSPSQLCDDLGFTDDAREKRAAGKIRDSTKNPERVRLAKLIHDLNDSLRQIPGLGTARPVRYLKREKRYVLEGAQVASRESNEPLARRKRHAVRGTRARP